MDRNWTLYEGMEPYIFISYSHDDRERVFPVVGAIEKHGFRYWFDPGISAGDIWTKTASERLKNCAVFLAFPSSAYFKHDNKPENCMDEIRLARKWNKTRLCAWLNSPNKDRIPEEFDLLMVSRSSFFLDQYPDPAAFAEKLLTEKYFRPCRAPEPSDSPAAPVLRRAVNVGRNTASPSPAFVGRENRMRDIETAFRNGAAVVDLHGMGGMGKSEICKKLFQNYTEGPGTDLARSVAWVTWQGTIESTFYQQFPHITELNAELHGKQVGDYLRQQGRSLLVFLDNADTLVSNEERDDVSELEKLGCRVLLTSRTQWEGFYPVYADFLPPDEARTLYRRSLRKNSRRPGGDGDDAPDPVLDEILRLAAYHALTIHLLARTQYAAGFGAAELLNKLKRTGFGLTDVEEEIFYNPGSPRGKGAELTFQKQIARIFDLSELREVKNGADALRVLQGMSLLAPNVYIPVKTVRTWLDLLNLKGLNRAAETGWLNERTEDDGSRSVAIHPTVAAVVQYKDGPDAEYVDAVAGRLAGDMYVDTTEVFTTKLHAVDHAAALDRIAERLILQTYNYGWMLHQLGYLALLQGNYAAALEWFRKALRIRENVLGTEHPDTATTYNNIASVYWNMGDYAAALEWYQKAQPIVEKGFGKEHPNTGSVYNNIASVYWNMGDYAAALEWLQKALRIREKVLGTEHPDTADTYNNIAGVYWNMGDYAAALDWFQKALRIRENVLGAEHPDTATTYNNIGAVYYKMRQYQTAMEWMEKALAICLRVLGPEHPHTKSTQDWIAKATRALAEESSCEGNES